MTTPAICAAQAAEEKRDELAELERASRQAYEGGDYAKALAGAEQLLQILEPKYVDTLYRIACLHSRLGNRDKAYVWLERAVDAGFWDAQQMSADADLEPIRGDERFRALRKEAWANGYIAMLEREERVGFQKPDEVMRALAFKAGERVADIGAGSGYFTVRVARAVGPKGVVWAVDIHQPMLDYLQKRLHREKIENVQLKLVPADDPQLPAGGVDTILMVDTIHYIKERAAYAKKLLPALAPGGRVVIIDYIPKPWEERPWGPLPEQQVARATLDAELAEAGLKPVRVHEFLPEQYFVEYGAK